MAHVDDGKFNTTVSQQMLTAFEERKTFGNATSIILAPAFLLKVFYFIAVNYAARASTDVG
jgi:hypothetical protein